MNLSVNSVEDFCVWGPPEPADVANDEVRDPIDFFIPPLILLSVFTHPGNRGLLLSQGRSPLVRTSPLR